MKRQTEALTEGVFDLIVVGGGAFGAAAARDAALRGLKTALVERNDFGAGASAECFKMVHGGIRYLQHADLRRLRASCAERSALLAIAPHLVHPLPIVIPTYGFGRRGKAFLAAGMRVYDLLTANRNAHLCDPSRRIATTRLLGRAEVLNLFPGLDSRALTGGAVFEDGQMYNPPRLVLAFIRSAVEAGAVVANYLEATSFLREAGRIGGVRVRDRLDGSTFDVRARLVLNAAGPWADDLLRDAAGIPDWRRGHYSRDAYFVVDRSPRSRYGLAVPGHSRDRDAVLSRAARHLFVVPWREFLLAGVWHRSFAASPDEARVEQRELRDWLAEIRGAFPGFDVSSGDVSCVNFGLVPFGDGPSTDDDLSFGKESRFIDHRARHGLAGLVTVIGIRYTTARADAAAALDLLLQQSTGATPPPAPTDRLPLAGGAIEDFASFRARAQRERAESIGTRSLDALLRNHGTHYRQILERSRSAADEARVVPGTETLVAEVTHAVREEMALRLEDVVLRRTDMGSGRHPGQAALQVVAERMQQLCGWSDTRRREEIEATQRTLACHRGLSVENAAAA